MTEYCYIIIFFFRRWFLIVSTILISIWPIALRADTDQLQGLHGLKMGPPVVGDPWNAQTIRSLYGGNISASWLKFDQAAGNLVYDTPLSAIILLKEWGASLLFKDGAIGYAIGTKCQVENPDSHWNQIHCIAELTNFFFFRRLQTREANPNCQDFARTVNQAFGVLKMPYAFSETQYVSTPRGYNHVANRLVFVARDGKTYSYLMDSVFAPGTLFPLAEFTQVFHDPQSVGKSTNLTLPPIR